MLIDDILEWKNTGEELRTTPTQKSHEKILERLQAKKIKYSSLMSKFQNDMFRLLCDFGMIFFALVTPGFLLSTPRFPHTTMYQEAM